MSRSPSRTDSTTIGTVLHPRRPRITSTPSMPGRPRSSTTTSGWWPAASVERVLAVGREVDVVAAGAQVDAERAQDLRLVVDDQHPRHVAAGRLMTIVTPPPGVSSTSSSPPIASTKPARHREAEPDAAAVGAVAQTLERAEHVLALRRRDAGTAVDHVEVDPSLRDARFDAHRGRRRRPRDRVLDHVGDRPLEQRGVGVHARQRLVDVDLHPARPA